MILVSNRSDQGQGEMISCLLTAKFREDIHQSWKTLQHSTRVIYSRNVSYFISSWLQVLRGFIVLQLYTTLYYCVFLLLFYFLFFCELRIVWYYYTTKSATTFHLKRNVFYNNFCVCVSCCRFNSMPQKKEEFLFNVNIFIILEICNYYRGVNPYRGTLVV